MMKENGKTKSEKVPVLRSICEGGWTSLLFAFSLLLFTFCAQAGNTTTASLPGVGGTLNNGYVYTVNDNTTLAATTAGQSALSVADKAKVVINIPSGVTLTCIGGNASGRTAAGAGIYVPSTSTLIVVGGGTLNATGGNAASGSNGSNGGDASMNTTDFSGHGGGIGGYGGAGGAGGGGAGAGIGGTGGTGGPQVSGTKLQCNLYTFDGAGTKGNSGGNGGSGTTMGSVYVLGNVSVHGYRGSSGSSGGSAGDRGTNKDSSSFGWSNGYAAGCGGGGGGGAGCYPTYGIGGGGGGGGGGGSGGSGGTMSRKGKYYSYLKGACGNGGKAYPLRAADGSGGEKETGYTSPSGTSTYGGAAGAAGSYGSVGTDGSLYKYSSASLTDNGGRTPSTTDGKLDEIKYEVTLDLNDGSSGSSTVYVYFGLAESVEVPSRTGYTFLGYYTSKEGGTQYFDANGTATRSWDMFGGTTLYAQWEATAIPVEGDVSVKVDDEWITNHGLEGKTEEEIKEKLNETDTTGTGLKKWQNWALGVEDGDKDAKPAFTGAAKSATEGKVSFTVPGYAGNGKSGVTATRKLVKKVGASTTETALALDAEAVEVDEGDVSAATPVALYTTVVEFTNANGEPVKSENTVGVMYVGASAKKTMVAVPWEQVGGGAISAADLIDTRDLADGDLLHVYDKANGQYRTWTLKDGAWTEGKTFRITEGKVSESSSGTATDMTVSRGDGVWLERDNTEKPIHLIGQYNAEKATLPSAAGWNICGNAGIEAAAVAGLGAGDGDIIIVPTEAEPIRYTKKDGAWGRYKEEVAEKTVGSRTVKVKTSKWEVGGTVGVGQGFWLVK